MPSERKLSPLPWDHDMVDPKDRIVEPYEIITDADGNTLFDTCNSEVSVIEFSDEDGPPRVDAQGAVNARFLCLAVNVHHELLQACQKAYRVIKDFIDPEQEGDPVMDDAVRVHEELRELIAVIKHRTPAIEAVDERRRYDPLLDEAARVVIKAGRGSMALLQRKLCVNYSRAARLIEEMIAVGVLGDRHGKIAREVLMTLDQWDARKVTSKRAANAEETG